LTALFVVHQVLGRLARLDPAVMGLAAQRRGGGSAVPLSLADQGLGGLFLMCAHVAIALEGDAVIFAHDRGLDLLVQGAAGGSPRRRGSKGRPMRGRVL
jgi:hypothetical protein